MEPEKLTRAAKILMQEQLHIFFMPKPAKITHVCVLFCVTCDDQELCSRITLFVPCTNNFKPRDEAEFSSRVRFCPERYLIYIVYKQSDYKLINRKQQLPSKDDHAQFENVLKTLRSLKSVEVSCAKHLRTDSLTNEGSILQCVV